MKGFYVCDISSLISVHSNCIDSIYTDLCGLVVWYLKRLPGLNSKSGLVLSTVNSFQLMIQFCNFWSNIYIFAIYFLTEYQIREYVQLCYIRIYFFKMQSATFLPIFSFFYVNVTIPRNIPFYVMFLSTYKNCVIFISRINWSPFGLNSEVDWYQVIFVFPFRFLYSGTFAFLYQYSSSDEIVGVATGLGDTHFSGVPDTVLI